MAALASHPFQRQQSTFFRGSLRNSTQSTQTSVFGFGDLSSSEGLESIARSEVEFGINILGATHPDLTVTPLIHDPFMLICRRDHPLARKRYHPSSSLKRVKIGRRSWVKFAS